MIISLAIIAILAILIIWFLFVAIAKGLDNKFGDSDLFNNNLENDRTDFQSNSCGTKENSENS